MTLPTSKEVALTEYLKELGSWVSNIKASRDKMKYMLLEEKAVMHPDKSSSSTPQSLLKTHKAAIHGTAAKHRCSVLGRPEIVVAFEYIHLSDTTEVSMLMRVGQHGEYRCATTGVTKPLAMHMVSKGLAVVSLDAMRKRYVMVCSMAEGVREGLLRNMEREAVEEEITHSDWPESLEDLAEPIPETVRETIKPQKEKETPMIKDDQLGTVKSEIASLAKSAVHLAAGQAALAIVRAFVLNAIPKKMGLLARLTGKKQAIHTFLNSALGSFVVAATAHTFFTLVMPNHKKIHVVTRAALGAAMAELALKVPYQRMADSLAEQLVNNSVTSQLLEESKSTKEDSKS